MTSAEIAKQYLEQVDQAVRDATGPDFDLWQGGAVAVPLSLALITSIRAFLAVEAMCPRRDIHRHGDYIHHGGICPMKDDR